MVHPSQAMTVLITVLYQVRGAAHLVHGRRIPVIWLHSNVRDYWVAQRLVLQQALQLTIAQVQPVACNKGFADSTTLDY